MQIGNKIVVNDISEVMIKGIEKRKDIEYILVLTIYGTKEEAKYLPIFIEKQDFIICKKKIDSIAKKVWKNSSNQYGMFASLCKTLSDYYEINGKEIIKEAAACKNVKLLNRIQGLYGLLVEHCASCFGVSFCLYNLCKTVGIDCVIVNGIPKKKEEEGHAWNMVKLEGKWYCIDLMWGMESLKQGVFPLNEFLKSSADFHHRELFDYYYEDFERKYCLETFPPSNQFLLFQKSENKKGKKRLLISNRRELR